ncbi:GNAT family N-acetyltransferase [Actinoplanes sp. TBRC 11911]|uniref:GNAT family N-acetyltransferase n=1 Tax=Actinoplanes sp. TBRC 11911 TaxID=2729386 RepID=UPI00145ED8C3|nr:GNAT family N-acetyltransferase [Actinoplanes sp. TBRC 11911]NMO53559.1 GNAT family N-acetyltransferase [Actinoplanes sp. TBRC 11911]
MEVRALTPHALHDVRDLFGTSSVTRGCWCVWFLVRGQAAHDGWGSVNQERFEHLVSDGAEPAGVLAYDSEGRPVGWCATGPRSRYARVLRSPLTAPTRDATEDDAVWFVPCFYVRPASRRAGLTRRLLDAAAAEATRHGAKAIEGFPLAGPGPHRDDRYLGTEGLFAACGFTEVARPSPRRVVMRREL